MPDLISYLYIAPAALIAIIFHEVSHGLMSYWLGDPTPKEEGRLTLNPIKHLDPIGTLCLIVFKFGWAKPVRVNPRYYKNPKWGMALVGLAGPLANYLTAFLSGLFLFLMIRFAPATMLTEIVCTFLMYVIMINVGLGTFNLIPIPPLDGSKIVGAILPEEAYYQYMKYQKYGTFIILGLLILLDVLTIFGLPSLLDVILTSIYEFIIEFWANIFL